MSLSFPNHLFLMVIVFFVISFLFFLSIVNCQSLR
ncbi:hypothetical protein PARMER_02748 [Parabacteroides merdae ATCC 43184]|nr:hypothetical protein PARMER_02748 [Parabacteroides merdae ATCC 43184]